MSQKFSTDNEHTIDVLTDDISDDIVKTSRIILRTEDINFTGGLSKKILQYSQGKFKFIKFDSPYAEFVEDGMPPGEDIDMSKLRKWVEKKVGIKDPEVLSIVTGNIAKKIEKDGIVPKRFLAKSLDVVIKRWGKKERNRGARKANNTKSILKIAKTVKRVVGKINKLFGR